MGNRAWRTIPRPLLETVLNNHAQHHTVTQPLFLHGPRGVGKTTLILNRLLDNWNKPPHFTAYVDLARAIHPDPLHPYPWTSWAFNTLSDPPNLASLRSLIELSLEELVQNGVRLGCIGSQQVFSTLNKWHGINAALRRIISQAKDVDSGGLADGKVPVSVLWSRAVLSMGSRLSGGEIDRVLGIGDDKGRVLTVEEKGYFREAMLSLRVAKEVIGIHEKWRANAVADLNRSGGYSRSLANSATDWACLLVELLSVNAELDHFQPKLVINNIDILRNAILTDDDSMVSASMFHDSFLWRLVALGANERSFPIILVTSDSYYSYQITFDFGYPEIFISRETFGWTPQEAEMHMVTDYFSKSEWQVIVKLLGPCQRHLSELYALTQSTYYHKIMHDDGGGTFEDVLDAYLAHLQVNVVNPAMERVLALLQKFIVDAQSGKIAKDRLRFGAPWRHPPRSESSKLHEEWAKLQLIDFIQSMVNCKFGVNYFGDYFLEFLDDPAATAMLEVGLLYTQRDPSYIRPISRGIQRCLVRWLVQEKMRMSFLQSIQYTWHRLIRGRSYRHLMKEAGYKF
ncbi:hypothetical protein Scep_012731 [Stephania cephalantha]|uniref:Uncharacterized protein n=1 Tax=Stephania cephalantha TaxID=152367 RepID=A0AAP0JHF4_9MAGN